jgi:hypothetical protein
MTIAMMTVRSPADARDTRAMASRMAGTASQGQPNMAWSHPAFRKPIITGFRMSAATQE